MMALLELYNKNKVPIITTAVLAKILVVMVVVPLFTDIFPNLYQADHFPDRYDLIAENLLGGNGYKIYAETGETMQRLPGFVLILAALFSVFGKSLIAAKVVNLIFSFLTAYTIILLGERFFRYRALAYLAAAVFLFYPGTILSESRGGLESIFTFFLTAFVYCFYKALESEKPLDYLLAGLFLGISTIIKSTTLIMPGVVFGYLIVRHLLSSENKMSGLWPILRNTILITLPMVLILTPWVMRNYAISDTMVLTQTNLGTTAYQGVKVNDEWPSDRDHAEIIKDATKELDVIGRDMGLQFKSDFFQHFYDPKDEVFFNRYVSDSIKQRYIESPMLLVKNSLLNLVRFWFQGRTHKSTLMNTVLVAPLLILFFIGFYRLIRQQVDIWPVFFIAGFFVAGHLPILATARYHIPLVPLLALFAVAAFLPRPQEHRIREQAAVSAT